MGGASSSAYCDPDWWVGLLQPTVTVLLLQVGPDPHLLHLPGLQRLLRPLLLRAGSLLYYTVRS